jgi:TonB family protein
VFAVYPFDAVVAGRKGSADVKVVVGMTGRVLGTKVIRSSSPEFGFALAAAMDAWKFEPAMKDNVPVMTVVDRKLEFAVGRRESAVDEAAAEIASHIKANTFRPANARELDARLAPRFTVAPVYPTALEERNIEGEAVIEVIIDKTGRVVLPRIVKASEPEFGWAAATAAQRWLFVPPTVKGKPVEVVVQIPFAFGAQSAPE